MESFEIDQANIAIIGLGLMGGSLAAALQGKCRSLVGIDLNTDVLLLAQQMRLCDKVSTDFKVLNEGIDMIILSIPVKSIIKLLPKIAIYNSGPCVVFDIGSTKNDIINSMMDLPTRFESIGGHPMCGKEVGMLINADKELFRGAPFAVISLSNTTMHAHYLVEDLIRKIGSYPVWLDAETHDIWVANTSHVPYLISNIMAGITQLEVEPLIGPGFRGTTRVAGTDPQMMLDAIETNRNNIIEIICRYYDKLGKVIDVLRADDIESLKKYLLDGYEQYFTLIDKTR